MTYPGKCADCPTGMQKGCAVGFYKQCPHGHEDDRQALLQWRKRIQSAQDAPPSPEDYGDDTIRAG